jgi:hypothetical protein
MITYNFWAEWLSTYEQQKLYLELQSLNKALITRGGHNGVIVCSNIRQVNPHAPYLYVLDGYYKYTARIGQGSRIYNYTHVGWLFRIKMSILARIRH